MAFIDGAALGVALPAMQTEMNATGADLLWVANGFSVPLAALLLLGGGLGDALGRKRTLVAGIGIFTGASVACGLAPGVHALIVGRVGQGIGGALMIPGALAMISTYFDPAQRGRAIGTWSAFTVLATALGPVLGGFLAGAGLWRYVFFMNIPLAAITLLLLLLKIPVDQAPRHRVCIDWWGALSVSAGMAGLTYGLIQWSQAGLDDRVVPVTVLAGALALIVFVVIQRNVRQPLLPLDIFRSRTLTVACLLTLLFYVATYGFLFFLPLNLIQVQHYDPAVAGLAQLPLMVMVIVLSRSAGKLVDRHGPRLPLTIGPALAGIGFWLLAAPGVTAGAGDFAETFLPGLLLVGAGLGLSAAPLSTTVIGAVSPRHVGLASGINSTLSRFAAVLAIATLGPVAIVAFDRSLEAHVARLGLPAEAQARLKHESVRLSETRPPVGLSPEASLEVRKAVELAFVDAFRLIAWLAAALSWIGALLAVCLPGGWTVGKLPPKKRPGLADVSA
jgi:EmrB/QacA subfamily drug resistance transporter